MQRKRWIKAQEYERSFWEKAANRIATGQASQLDWYSWKADEMEKRLAPYMSDEKKKDANVLEIGSGPVGIVSFIRWGKRYAIDSLEDYYKLNPNLSHLRDRSVTYNCGTSENLPFNSGYFTLVILDNVLDHVHEASRTLREINRILSPDGVFYFAVNIHTNWGAFLHRILAKLLIDRGHPHTFTVNSIRTFLASHQFRIMRETISDYDSAKKQDISSSSLKNKIKGISGLSEFIYYAVNAKKGDK